MRTLVHQASLFAFFALGLAGLMAALCQDAAHGPCFALCCGLIPGLTAALLVPTLTAGVSVLVRARGPRRQSLGMQSELCNLQSEIAPSPGLAYCALASWLATLWLSVEVCPLVCARLCGPCAHTNAGTVGFCAFFFARLYPPAVNWSGRVSYRPQHYRTSRRGLRCSSSPMRLQQL